MTRDSRLATASAFAIIYFVWGSTFLAIRFGVSEVPPFLFAAMRFLAAGLILYLWSTARSEPMSTPLSCRSSKCHRASSPTAGAGAVS